MVYRLKSHPGPDRTLHKHLNAVANKCLELCNSYKHVLDSCSYSEDLDNLAFIVGATHDFAKSTSFFQDMLEGKRGRSPDSWHSGLSSLFTYFVCRKMHGDNEQYCVACYLSVKRHHGDLRNVIGVETQLGDDLELFQKQINNIKEINSDGFCAQDELIKIYQDLLPNIRVDEFLESDILLLCKSIKKSLKKIAFGKNFHTYFNTLLLYSALQEADKSDAGIIFTPARDYSINNEMIPRYRSLKFKTNSKISQIRSQAFNEIISQISDAKRSGERIFSITLPTGFGKTIIGLACAFLIRNKYEKIAEPVPRIIYSLPFLSIIDQNSSVIKEVITNYLGTKEVPSNLLLVHHHLSDPTYRLIERSDENESIDMSSSLFLVEGWNSEIIVTTFVQFFESIITNRKNMLRKFNKIAGSIIILDEIQAIPAKYWGVVEEALVYLSKNLGCWIILMTATKPAILKNCKELAQIKNLDYADRVKYTFRKEHSLDAVIETIISSLGSVRSILAVANTIGESKEIHRMLREILDVRYGLSKVDQDGVREYEGVKLLYLSSSVLPKERVKRISLIKDSALNNSSKIIVVSTQVVEAGVDIDMDRVIRDFGPLDSIVQCGGRCNRNGFSVIPGDTIVFPLRDEVSGRQFCTYIYDPILISATRNFVSSIPSQSVYEKDILNDVNTYFDQVLDRKAQEKTAEFMKGLDFDNIGDFKLIDDYMSIQVFLEVDENAKNLRDLIEKNKLSELLDSSPKLKMILSNCTLTVRKPKEIQIAETLPTINGTEIKYVPNEELSEWYDIETGLNLRLSQAIERRII